MRNYSKLIVIALLCCWPFVCPVSPVYAASVAAGCTPSGKVVNAVTGAGQLQLALNNARAGDRVHLPPGTYNFSQLNIPGNVILEAVPNTVVLQGTSSPAVIFGGSNITASGFTIKGPADVSSLTNGNHDNLKIDNVEFAPGNSNAGLRLGGVGNNGSTISNSSITNCQFDLPVDQIGLYFWVTAPPDSSKGHEADFNASQLICWQHVLIDHCYFKGQIDGNGNVIASGKQNEGLHFRGETPAPASGDFGPGRSVDCQISYCTFAGIARSNIEYQGGGIDTVIRGNYFYKFALTGNPKIDSGSIVCSCAADASLRQLIEMNYIFSTSSIGPVQSYEVSGHSVICQNNFSWGGNQGFVLQTSTNGKVIHNRIGNAHSGSYAVGGAVNPMLLDNTPTTALTWDPTTLKPPMPNGMPVVVTTQPAQQLPVSPNDAIVPPLAFVTDANGGTYTVSGGQVKTNGVIDAATNSCAGVLIEDGVPYQFTTAGMYWTLPGNIAHMVNDPHHSPTTQPTTQPATQPATQPVVKLNSVDLVLKYSDGTQRMSTTQP